MASYLVTCGACGTANRIPVEKEGLSGRCGSCRAVLTPLYVRPRPLTESSFDEFVRGYQGPVLAEFWAPW